MNLSQAPRAHSLLTPGGSFRAGFSLETSLLDSVVGGSFPEGGRGARGRAATGLWAPFSPGAHSLTSPTAFTTGKCRSPIVLNRLKTWETLLLGETVKGDGFMYGVTSCGGKTTSFPRPALP